MKKTKIEWCDSTWNPITGCNHGCQYCYARAIVTRFGGKAINIPRILQEPFIAAGKKKPYPFGFTPTYHRYRLSIPAQWTKPRTIFVCSVADMFGDWVPDEWIEEIFKATDEAPRHRYLFLTKNPNRYRELYEKGIMPKGTAAWNKWYGCSITTPEDEFYWVDENALGIDHYGFLSIEPLLADFSTNGIIPNCIRWFIIGAETGNRKGKITPKREWIEHICEVADKSGIKVFMKDSLLPIIGEENMRREFPWEV